MVIKMKTNKLFLISVSVCSALAITSLILCRDGTVGAFMVCIWQSFEIKNALIPTKPGFQIGVAHNPSKSWHSKRGTLKRYRLECIISYVIFFLVGVFFLVTNIINL